MYEPSDASTEAGRFIKRLGFDLATGPENPIPVLPADITIVPEQELMVLFMEVNSWIDYVEVYFVAAQIDEKQEEQLLEEIAAKEQIKNKSAKTVAAMKAQTFDNPEYAEQKKKVFTIFARRRMMETVYNSLQRKQFILSREITRRKYGHD